MSALATGSAGLALVMCFALLCTAQLRGATIMLMIQSGALAVAAVVLHQPLMAFPPLVLAAGIWGGGIWRRRQTTDPALAGGEKLSVGRWGVPGVVLGAVLAILCQSQAGFALPLAIVLLSILLAVTRPHPLMRVVALVSAQNGIALAGCLPIQPETFQATPLLPAACVILPLPLAAGLLAPPVWSLPTRRTLSLAHSRLTNAAEWLRSADLGIALAIFAATLIVPLDSLASIFAPLFGLDGVLRSCVRWNRNALPPLRRGTALAQTGFIVLAACAPNLIAGWLAVVCAMATTLLPALSRRWDSAVLAFFGAGLALFGILVLLSAPSMLGYFSLFAGFTAIAAIVPDLAVVLVILTLRLADQASWPPEVAALGSSIALLALLACALLLTSRVKSRRVTLLLLSQASIAALAICMGESEGRFAALVLLILLILTRSAARLSKGPAATLAVAGLGGVPPFGVFPALVLIVLTMSARGPWFLLPLGAALVPILLASLPGNVPDFSPRRTMPSIAWLPLLLAVLIGYCAPDGLTHWWRILTAGGT
jgi:hypothetical protein